MSTEDPSLSQVVRIISDVQLLNLWIQTRSISQVQSTYEIIKATTVIYFLMGILTITAAAADSGHLVSLAR